jgi:hypothetical protein
LSLLVVYGRWLGMPNGVLACGVWTLGGAVPDGRR